MQFAPVLPINFYPILDRGMYHLVQPHLFEGARQELLEWFWDRGAQDPQHTTILDNGVIELGEAAEEALLKTLEIIEPDIIIVPDVFQRAEPTMQNYERWLDMLPDVMPHIRNIMIVPQGRDVAEWCYCAYNMIMLSYAQGLTPLIGVPKVLDQDAEEPTNTGRYAALCWMRDFDPDLIQRVHLLGIWESTPQLLRVLQEFPEVQGVDSTLPYAHATYGLNSYALPGKKSIPEGEWMMEYDEEKHRRLVWQAEVNIAYVRQTLQSFVERNVAAVVSNELRRFSAKVALQNRRSRSS